MIKQTLFFVPLLLLAVSITFSGVSRAAANCNQLSLDESIKQANKLTTLLKIANFRADVTYMGQLVAELKQFLSSCGDLDGGKLAMVCNYDCHLNLARYHLFMASDFPFLATANGVNRNDSPLAPQQLQKHADEGVAILDRAFKVIGRQQAGNLEDTDTGAGQSLREFYRQQNMLYLLKIQLLMVSGDIWYQSISEARSKRLGYLITTNVGVVGDPGREGDYNLTRAANFYERASWVLIEARTDIPGESSYDDLRAELLSFDNDLKQRLTSINNGLLYLNIDPEQFTTISFADLQEEMRVVQNNLQNAESTVQALVEQWHHSRQGEDTRQIDENRIVQGQQANLLAHKIGKLESLSKEYTAKISVDLNKVDEARDSAEYRQRVRQMEIDLSTKLEELSHRRENIQLKQALDLIINNKESSMEQRNEIRWLISVALTDLNFRMQVASLENQKTEYQRQLERNQNRIEQISFEQKQKELAIANDHNRIEEMQKKIEELTYRKQELYLRQRAVVRESLCQIEDELLFIGQPISQKFTPIAGESACLAINPKYTLAAYVKEMCGTEKPDGTRDGGLRGMLHRQRVSARAFLVRCIMGEADAEDLMAIKDGFSLPKELSYGSFEVTSEDPSPKSTLAEELDKVKCGTYTASEKAFAKQIWEQEKLRAENAKSEVATKVTALNKSMENLSGAFRYVTEGVKGIEAVVLAAEAAVMVAAAMPTVSTGGPTCTFSTFDGARAVQAKLESVRAALQAMFEYGKFRVEHKREMERLQREVDDLALSVKAIDIDLTSKALALHRAHFELSGRVAGTKYEIQELLLQGKISDFDCKNEERGVDERVSQLSSEHKRLLATIDLGTSQNKLLDYEIDGQMKGISRAQNEIAIYQIQKQDLEVQVKQANADNTHITQLVASLNERISDVTTTKNQVDNYSLESQKVTNIIVDLQKQQQQSLLALSEHELNYVETRLHHEKSNTDELLELLGKAQALTEKNHELQTLLLQSQVETAKAINQEQDALLQLVSQVDSGEEKKNLFIASEESIAELLKGLPEYLSFKRRELETANLLLHLIRKRYNTIVGLTGPEGSSAETSAYVKSATQLATLVNNITRARFFNEKQVKIDMAEIVIPSTSGFVRTFAKNGRVLFELSPRVTSASDMEERGYFTLWDKNKFGSNRNLSLIDILIGVQYSCTGDHRNNFTFIHKGSGVMFNKIAPDSDEIVPSLFVNQARSYVTPFYNLTTEHDRIKAILDFWRGRFDVRKFPPLPGPINDSDSKLPLLGAPLIANYELIQEPSSCGYDDAVFTLYVIFASEL
ncbi:MAG: hypothetical protein HQK50_08695 [Oligoflexia bacterium]|nr:hypothetical protein [Oligoflexia bacterium]